jgi:predicted nucleotidyltransferase
MELNVHTESTAVMNNMMLIELKAVLKEFLGERVALILYGSQARGDYSAESDIDIAIIVQGLTRDIKNQILNVVADIEIAYFTPLSTLVLSEESFEFLKKRERRIALDIEKEGISL